MLSSHGLPSSGEDAADDLSTRFNSASEVSEPLGPPPPSFALPFDDFFLFFIFDVLILTMAPSLSSRSASRSSAVIGFYMGSSKSPSLVVALDDADGPPPHKALSPTPLPPDLVFGNGDPITPPSDEVKFNLNPLLNTPGATSVTSSSHQLTSSLLCSLVVFSFGFRLCVQVSPLDRRVWRIISSDERLCSSTFFVLREVPFVGTHLKPLLFTCEVVVQCLELTR